MDLILKFKILKKFKGIPNQRHRKIQKTYSSQIFINNGLIKRIYTRWNHRKIQTSRITINAPKRRNTQELITPEALSNILWVLFLDFDFFVQDISFVPSYSHVS